MALPVVKARTRKVSRSLQLRANPTMLRRQSNKRWSIHWSPRGKDEVHPVHLEHCGQFRRLKRRRPSGFDWRYLAVWPHRPSLDRDLMPIAPIHFIQVVWGTEYTRRLIDLALPSHLSPGNLGAVAGDPTAEYWIYTTQEDEREIRASAVFARLSQMIKVKFCYFPHAISGFSNRYAAMTWAHQHAITEGRKIGAALVFVPPDAVWSDGSFTHAISLMNAGKRFVMVAGVRVQAETFVPALENERCRDAQGALVIPARVQARLTMAHLHTISRSLIWDAPLLSSIPSNIYWPVGDAGMVIRAYHLHPFMVRPRPEASDFKGTIDDGLVHVSADSDNEVAIVTDTDLIFPTEISTERIKHPPTIEKIGRVAAVAMWASAHANALHQRYVWHHIHLHSGEIDGNWDEVRKESDKIIQRVEWLLQEGMGKSLVLAEVESLRRAYMAEAMRGEALDRIIGRMMSPYFWVAERIAAPDKISKAMGLMRRTFLRITGHSHER